MFQSAALNSSRPETGPAAARPGRPLLVSLPTARDVPAYPAVNRLITDHLPLVGQVLKQVSARYPRHADFDEMRQAATLGLVEAAHRFDADRGVPFERWAALRIRGAIVDSVRSVDFAPRALRAAGRDLERATAELTGRLDRQPTPDELAEHLGCSTVELRRTQARIHGSLVLSLDGAGTNDPEAQTLAERLVSAEPEPAAALVDHDEQLALRDAVAMLPERLRDVVAGYFLDGESSAELADRLGVTESRISQLRSEALRMLRAGLDHVAVERRQPTTARTPRPAGRLEREAARKAQYADRLLARRPLTARAIVPTQRPVRMLQVASA